MAGHKITNFALDLSLRLIFWLPEPLHPRHHSCRQEMSSERATITSVFQTEQIRMFKKKKIPTAKARLWVCWKEQLFSFLLVFSPHFCARCKPLTPHTAMPVWKWDRKQYMGSKTHSAYALLHRAPTPAWSLAQCLLPLKPCTVRSYYCKEKSRSGKSRRCCVQGAKMSSAGILPCLVWSMLGLQESKQNEHKVLKVHNIHSAIIQPFSSASLRKYHKKSFIKKPVNHPNFFNKLFNMVSFKQKSLKVKKSKISKYCISF